MAEIMLTDDERGAAAWAVNHLIEKHGYSSIVSRTSPRVGLEELLEKLLCRRRPNADGGMIVANAHDKIAALSEWIDQSYFDDRDSGILPGSELHVRRRVDKIMEEAGEVGQAVGGWYGENPRKGITHTRADVLGELLDVAITALGAYESLTGNAGSSGPALDAKIDFILARVGLNSSGGTAPLPQGLVPGAGE